MTTRTTKVLHLSALCFVLLLTSAASTQLQREMSVRQGPETVFKRPVDEVIPELKGAKPTGRNGRVGNEFVFWGYKLKAGKIAYLYVCAPAAGVDCHERRALICDNSVTVLSEGAEPGAVQKFSCKQICLPDQNDALPCCTGRLEQPTLNIGLVSCG